MNHKNSNKNLTVFSCIIKKLRRLVLRNISIFGFITVCIVMLTSSFTLINRIVMLNLHMKTSPKTFDPRKAADVFSSQVIFLLFEGLVKRYPDGSIKLAQAKSYKVSDNKLTHTFTLGDNLWSNGEPVTAYDFEQSWKDTLDPKFPSIGYHQFEPIKNAKKAKEGLVSLNQVGIKALDEKTLVIELEHPTPYFLKLICLPYFYPVNIEQDRKNPNWVIQTGTQFLCNGPFILESFKQGDQIVLNANPQYRKIEDNHPEKIVFNIVESDHVTLEMFKKGKVDMIGDSLTDIPLEEVSELEKKWTFNSEPQPYSVFIYLNTTKQPFNNAKIRKAFALAINRQELLGMLGKGYKKNIKTNSINLAYKTGLCATGLVAPCLKENRCSQFFKDNDAAQANILLNEGMAELGITKEAFKSLTFLYCSRVYGADEIVQIIQQQLAKTFGIFIKLEKLDFSVATDRLNNGDYSMCLGSWLAFYDDPINVLQRFKYKNYKMNRTGWENPKFIELIDRSNYEEGDKRLLTLEEAERVMINDMPVIPLYHRNYIYLMNPELEFNVSLWGDRLLFPLSSEQKEVQKENKHVKKKNSYFFKFTK
ncbi:Oligopeptide-binding protein OppA [Candidatus Rhabdochlamydia oedothoracis]|uniref:Oligopeptide-binding protein OppA n=1 Tax=Candidatus Rhabdochlamydia oedothoracis TaxID=2720720 RepID=A0ABX8V3C9_9BACT|nr:MULTISPECIES: peptide ABC transporter substrate-binding protein [Rhabdochlamydia]KAG6559321.1 Oligopeptide-binding protein OppA [Candidatus Rhabdochlamydia sp. W815]MCL6756291.1 peptide ABC transporter substrate-binding protein [Candidatus Rhabdochlamydia oedothoracis]QYF49381.1 Oligopeptide-binding protein OppA [Candidatus Rhabdochlamydia oedothoracis]